MLSSVSVLFFFSSRRRHTRCSRDWSSDVCSSDLCPLRRGWRSGHGPAGTVLRGGLLDVEQDVRRDELRSEERRVGKECRSRWSPYHLKKNNNRSEAHRVVRKSISLWSPYH